MPNPFISTADIQMPEYVRGSGGGGKTKYDFLNLPIGKSIAVFEKTAKQLSSTINTANNGEWPVFDAKGKPVMVAAIERNKDGTPVMVPEMKDGKPVMEDGKPKMTTKPKLEADGKPKMEQKKEAKSRHFFAYDCAENDPEGAKCRIWRDK